MTPTTLAIDFGTVRIGLAISRGTLADPLEIIPNNEAKFERLKQIIDEETVQQVIVGLSENNMAELTKQFVEELKQHIELPVELVDETLSSHTVHQKSINGTMSQSQRQQPIDHLAAAEFLQEWLDTVTAKNSPL